MKLLIQKEIRLLLPAWGVALILSVLPPVLVRNANFPPPVSALAAMLSLGSILVALSTFGREFSLGTFQLFLSQPVERAKLWRLKVSVLAVGLLALLLAFYLSVYLTTPPHLQMVRRSEILALGAIGVAVGLGGGLWTTLLLRQAVGAFWFSLLVPGSILMVVDNRDPAIVCAALLIYSAAGFFWARQLFLNAQEAGWGSTEVGLGKLWGGRIAQQRQEARWAALFWKEIRLHQVGLFGIAWLAVVHLGVLWLRRTIHPGEANDALLSTLQMFGGIWLITPLVIGSLAIAEERKLGTLQAHLALPVARKWQFVMKFGIVIALAGVLCPSLLWLIESVGQLIGASSNVAGLKSAFELIVWLQLCLGFSLLAFAGFYASSLTANVIQGLAAALATLAVAAVVLASAAFPERSVSFKLWHGQLFMCFAWPALLVTGLWLALRNFQTLKEGGALWKRNLLTWLSVGAGVAVLTAGVYHRVWELVLPLEPGHGPAVIARSPAPKLSTFGNAGFALLLPSGRLWSDVFGYEKAPGVWHNVQVSRGRLTSVGGNHFVAGSTWVAASVSSRETVGIRSDGTLWVSQRPKAPDEFMMPGDAVPLVQFGKENDWKDVVRDYVWSVVLLKQDGSLWYWGMNNFSERNVWPGLHSFEPQRVESPTRWTQMMRPFGAIYLWDASGKVSAIHPSRHGDSRPELFPSRVLDRAPMFDGIYWKSMSRWDVYSSKWGVMTYQVGVREDGSLWLWIDPLANGTYQASELRQIGTDKNWRAVTAEWGVLCSLKQDGTLWRWKLRGNVRPDLDPAALRPVRLSKHRDWLALQESAEGLVALAADATLWLWSLDIPTTPHASLLAPSRRPVLLEKLPAQ